MNSSLFRERAAEKLAENKTANALAGRVKGDTGYLPEDHADVAELISVLLGRTIGQRHVDRILGAVRPGTKLKLINKTDLIGPIRKVLGLQTAAISVPADRADVLLRIASLPHKDFARFREAIDAMTK